MQDLIAALERPSMHFAATRLVVMLGSAITAMAMMGCACCTRQDKPQTPAAVGLNTNNLIDPSAQIPADLATGSDARAIAERDVGFAGSPTFSPRRSVLCLSAGGTYGAYTVGVLCGWTAHGDRPNFDVVTGVSTGAMIAPYAFLGSRYDGQIKDFFTRTRDKDIYRVHPFRLAFAESLADNTPLANKIDRMLTIEFMREIAVEHGKGRRLYVGTTEAEGRRFVAWDIGEIASRGTERDRQLIKSILLGSSAIPGFFPASKITVTVNGKPFVEKHVDGAVSQSLFFRPPYVAPELAGARSWNDVDVYAIVAGKLYADPGVTKPRAIKIATNDVSTIIYSQSRGDLQRLWALCAMNGMSFHLASMRPEFPAPKSSMEFDPRAMTSMFNEGVQEVLSGTAWRNTAPEGKPDETPLVRSGTNLIYLPRSPDAWSFGQPLLPPNGQPPSQPIAK